LKAVANSSVPIALSTIGKLALLSQRFPDGIHIPGAVWREVAIAGQGQPGVEEVASATWITSLRDQLDALQTEVRFRLSQSVHAEALRMVGEIAL
jgi:predicted nucleic acid-binding protein